MWSASVSRGANWGADARLRLKMCELANITPPIGLHAFVIKGIAPPGVQIESKFKGGSMFVVLDALTIALLVAYPEIVMWLPSTMD